MRSFGTLIVAGLAGSAVAAPMSAGPTPVERSDAFEVAKRAPLNSEGEVIAHIMRDIGSIDPAHVSSALARRSQVADDEQVDDSTSFISQLTARDLEYLEARNPGLVSTIKDIFKGKDKGNSGSSSGSSDSNDDKFFSNDRPIADPNSYDSYNDLGGNKPAKRSVDMELSARDVEELVARNPGLVTTIKNIFGKGKDKDSSSSSSSSSDSNDDKFFSNDRPIADPNSYDSYNDLGGNKPAKRSIDMELSTRDVEELIARNPGLVTTIKNIFGKGKDKDNSGSSSDSNDDKFFSNDRPIADPNSYDSYNDLGGNKPAKRSANMELSTRDVEELIARNPGLVSTIKNIFKGKDKGNSGSSSSNDSNDDKFFSNDRPIADPNSYDSYNDLGGNKPAKRDIQLSTRDVEELVARNPGLVTTIKNIFGKGKDKDNSGSSSSSSDSNDDKFFSNDRPIADPNSYDSYNDLGGNKPAKRSVELSARDVEELIARNPGLVTTIKNIFGKGKDKDKTTTSNDDSNDDKFMSNDRPIADPNSYDSYNDLGGNKPAKRDLQY